MKMNWRRKSLFVMWIMIFVLTGKFSFSSFAQRDLDQIAIRIVAERNGIPYERLYVENSAQASFRLQEISVSNFKIADRESAEVYAIALDRNGKEVSMDDLRQREREIYLSRYGKLEVDLANTIAAVPPYQPIRVNIWLNRVGEVRLERPSSDKEISQEEVNRIYAQLDQQRAEIARATNGPFVERLALMRIEATANELAPVVYAAIPAGQIREIADFEEVDQVYLDRRNKPELNVARVTIGADVVQSRGNLGQGVQVAQIEVGGRVAAGNPFLAVVQDPQFVCAGDSAHSTAVAGIIASSNNPMFGISPSVTLRAGGSCAGLSSELGDRSTAAQTWGARAFNLSWGSNIGLTPGGDDRFYDSMVIDGWRTVVKSAGNLGGNITSPGLAYNVITVGNFDDRGTTAWGDDVMNSSSSFIDPTSTHNDREKPEVAAPGTNITSTSTASPWNNFTGSGTSFAAPMVTGTAALMMNANGGLSVWPEGVKAILMATAVHNIEGSTRLSESDGAGGIDANRATNVARGVNGKWSARSYNCGDPNTLNVDSMFLTAGSRTRVAMAWDTNTTFWNFGYGNEPTADLDMQILGPTGNIVAGSLSFDNTYEIVDFIAPTTGTYTLRVNKFRCVHDPKWLGWAWNLQ